jgi:hypothetical protein
MKLERSNIRRTHRDARSERWGDVRESTVGTVRARVPQTQGWRAGVLTLPTAKTDTILNAGLEYGILRAL